MPARSSRPAEARSGAVAATMEPPQRAGIPSAPLGVPRDAVASIRRVPDPRPDHQAEAALAPCPERRAAAAGTSMAGSPEPRARLAADRRQASRAAVRALTFHLAPERRAACWVVVAEAPEAPARAVTAEAGDAVVRPEPASMARRGVVARLCRSQGHRPERRWAHAAPTAWAPLRVAPLASRTRAACRA
jgi:hypothetical protein